MDMKQICMNQVQEAKKYKWIKGIQTRKDPGEEAIHEWVKKYAEKYRIEYKEIYQAYVEKVFAETGRKLREEFPNLDEKVIREIQKYAIDSFTEIWVKDMSIHDVPPKHLDEI